MIKVSVNVMMCPYLWNVGTGILISDCGPHYLSTLSIRVMVNMMCSYLWNVGTGVEISDCGPDYLLLQLL